MELKSLLVDSKTTWVDFPGLDGFSVELANLSRKELQKLRKNSTENKFNRKSRVFEEIMNDDRFSLRFNGGQVEIYFWVKYHRKLLSRVTRVTYLFNPLFRR